VRTKPLGMGSWDIFADTIRERDARARGEPYESPLRKWVDTQYRENARCQFFLPYRPCEQRGEVCS
jgi:hypothetical protein